MIEKKLKKNRKMFIVADLVSLNVYFELSELMLRELTDISITSTSNKFLNKVNILLTCIIKQSNKIIFSK